MRYGPTHYNAKQLQVILAETICDETASARDKAQSVRVWIELEHLKRLIRGIPPLAPVTLSELLVVKMKRARPAALGELVEVEVEEVGDANLHD